MAFWEKPTEVKAEAPKTKKIDDTEWQDLLLNVDETESNVETQDVEILEKIQKIENQINKEWNKIPEWLKEKYIKIKNWIMAKSTELFNKYLEEKGEKVDSNDGEGVVNIDYYFNNRKARFFRKSDTGEAAYCIEPFTFFNENSTYESTLNPYNLSQEQKMRIERIAHFGYGYKNHTDAKWYAITQMMIWVKYGRIVTRSWFMMRWWNIKAF